MGRRAIEMRRALKILAWTFGGLVLLIIAAGGFVYVFATSDYVRAQIENHASAIAGRATKIARVRIDWGWTAHVSLEDVEVSNADWGKADHMLKAKLIDFDIRLWPLLGGHLVLPQLTMKSPSFFSSATTRGISTGARRKAPSPRRSPGRSPRSSARKPR